MSTLTEESIQLIREHLKGLYITRGIGDRRKHCSLAAINMALSGYLIDSIPDCMSNVIGRLIVGIQDLMPDDLRNSDEWRNLLPFAAGTGREHEQERSKIIYEWMWEIVLPTLQIAADENNFGKEWREMLSQKTVDVIRKVITKTASMGNNKWSAELLWISEAASSVLNAVDVMQGEALLITRVVHDVDNVIMYISHASRIMNGIDFWQIIDPCGLISKLINLE